jgi:hypothetical protein
MGIAPDRVREIFKGLENGNDDAFFAHVADGVDWEVMGTHPLAGSSWRQKSSIWSFSNASRRRLMTFHH